VPLAVIDADGALREVDGRPGQVTHFAHAEATPQHQQKHGAVPQGSDALKERADLLLRPSTMLKIQPYAAGTGSRLTR